MEVEHVKQGSFCQHKCSFYILLQVFAIYSSFLPQFPLVESYPFSFLLLCRAEVVEVVSHTLEAEIMGEVTSWSLSISVAVDRIISVLGHALGIANGRVVVQLDPCVMISQTLEVTNFLAQSNLFGERSVTDRKLTQSIGT